MFLILTLLGIIGIILFIILAIRKKIKIILTVIGLLVSVTVLLIGIYLGDQPAIDINKFDYIENVGWKTNGKTPMTEEEYKLSCTKELPYSTYKENPLLYEEIIYKASGVILNDEEINENGNSTIIVLSELGNTWVTGIYQNKSGKTYKSGDSVIIYGEYVGIDTEPEMLYMRIRYIEED
jgi:hypothetical protein